MTIQQTIRLAYRYRLYPIKAQVSLLRDTLAVCRNVYNACVHERTVLHELHGKSPGYLKQQNALPVWKAHHPELRTVFSQVLQDVVKRVDLAFQAFFRRIREGEEPGYPRLKAKDQYDSITYPQLGFGIVQGKLRLSKIGDVSIRLHRPIQGDIKTCTIRRTMTGKWYACFSCEVQPQQLPPSVEAMGIDVGIKVFAALSNGEMIPNPRFFRQEEKALAKAQRRFNKVNHKHRNNVRRKAKKIGARVHERIKHRRHDFLHQTARRLINRYGIIALEDLQVDNMMARPKAKPDPKNEGQFLPNGASQKSGLNKSIADVSWSMFRNILSMKAASAFRQVIAVPAAYTSQRCSGCGNIVPKALDVRVHSCPDCGLVIDRDTNAARNILSSAVGQYSLAARAA